MTMPMSLMPMPLPAAGAWGREEEGEGEGEGPMAGTRPMLMRDVSAEDARGSEKETEEMSPTVVSCGMGPDSYAACAVGPQPPTEEEYEEEVRTDAGLVSAPAPAPSGAHSRAGATARKTGMEAKAAGSSRRSPSSSSVASAGARPTRNAVPAPSRVPVLPPPAHVSRSAGTETAASGRMTKPHARLSAAKSTGTSARGARPRRTGSAPGEGGAEGGKERLSSRTTRTPRRRTGAPSPAERRDVAAM
jgi:hypothetical protein